MATSEGILGHERNPDDPIVDLRDAGDDSQTVTDEAATPRDAAQSELALPNVDALLVAEARFAPGHALGRSDLAESPCDQT
jgi:hypothetical protein